MLIQQFEQRLYEGQFLQKEEVMRLLSVDLHQLKEASHRIRAYFCGNQFDLCAIINGKSGCCSENCAFCAQSAHHHAMADEYALREKAVIVKDALHHDNMGVHRYAIVTSGRSLSNSDVDRVCDYNLEMKQQTGLQLCASHGLLTKKQLQRLKQSGVTRYHNNLETSRTYFPHICTTHTYDDKIQTILDAQDIGLEVCSGGIIGMGEDMEDRIDLALTLRELQIHSVPVNILNPIAGTPLMKQEPLSKEEIERTICIFRFILPDALIRLAGGRGLLDDGGKSLFACGANAAITGDMLTTQGISVASDQQLLRSLGYML